MKRIVTVQTIVLTLSLISTQSAVYATLGVSNASAYSVALQTDGTIIAAGSVTYNNVNQFAMASYTTSGVLNLVFGAEGLVFTPIGSTSNANAVQANGKIVLAGLSENNSTQFTVAQFTSSGALDTTFNGTGYVVTAIGDGSSANGVIFQTDNKVVVSGVTIVSGTPEFAVVRYNTNGSLDSSFGTGGIVTQLIGDSCVGHELALQSNNAIVVAGYCEILGVQQFAAMRLNSNGSLDSTFGTNGLVTIPVGSASQALSVVVQADGKIVLAGTSDNQFAVVRINSNGSLDNSFGTNGIVTTQIGSNDQINEIVIQANGELVAVGVSDSQFALALYTTSGSLDTGFGTNGIVVTPIGLTSEAYSAVIDADGNIIVAGNSEANFAVARYTSSGSLTVRLVFLVLFSNQVAHKGRTFLVLLMPISTQKQESFIQS